MHSAIKLAANKGLFKKLKLGGILGGRVMGPLIDQIIMPKLLAKASAKHKLEGSNNVTLATGFQKQTVKPVQTQELSRAVPALPQSQDAMSRRNLSLLQRKSLDSTEYEDPKDDLVSFERKSVIKSASPRRKPKPQIKMAEGIIMDKLTDSTKEATSRLSRAFEGGITVHSTQRDDKAQRKAMLEMPSVDVYHPKYRKPFPGGKALTPEQIKSAPGSPKRISAVDHILKRLKSLHKTGEAVDFSYRGMPGSWKKNGVETEAATDLRVKLGKRFPNSKVTLEKGHVHIGFVKKKSKPHTHSK
jgi:hypothetical protein